MGQDEHCDMRCDPGALNDVDHLLLPDPVDPEERPVGSGDSNHELDTGSADDVTPVGETTVQRRHLKVCRLGEFGYASDDISEDRVVAGRCHIARLYSRRSGIPQGWVSAKTLWSG